MARVLYLTMAILVALGGFAFHVRNSQEVIVNFVVTAVNVQLSWALVAALVVGAALGLLTMTGRLVRLQAELRRLKRRDERSQREVASLRALSLKDAG